MWYGEESTHDFSLTNLMIITGRSCHKYNFCRDKSFITTNACLSQQNIFVTSNKHTFVMTKDVLSRQNWYLWQLPSMIHDCHLYHYHKCITTIKGTTYILLVMTASLLFNGEGEHLWPEGKVLCLLDHLLVWRHCLCSHHNMTLQAKWRNRCQSEFCVDSSHSISVILFCLTAPMEAFSVECSHCHVCPGFLLLVGWLNLVLYHAQCRVQHVLMTDIQQGLTSFSE